MTKFLASLLLLVLVAESAPWMLMQAGGCSMPCCKRSGGRAACCRRPSASSQPGGAAGESCRMVACDTQARESTSIALHLPAILDGTVTLAYPPLTKPGFAPNVAPPRNLAEDPPTPPPKPLQA